MLYISVLEDLITDPNTEEQSTISTSEKEDFGEASNTNLIVFGLTRNKVAYSHE
jgi:hypothetical protein